MTQLAWETSLFLSKRPDIEFAVQKLLKATQEDSPSTDDESPHLDTLTRFQEVYAASEVSGVSEVVP